MFADPNAPTIYHPGNGLAVATVNPTPTYDRPEERIAQLTPTPRPAVDPMRLLQCSLLAEHLAASGAGTTAGAYFGPSDVTKPGTTGSYPNRPWRPGIPYHSPNTAQVQTAPTP